MKSPNNHKFEFSTHKRLALSISTGSNHQNQGIPQNFFIEMSFLFFSLDYVYEFKRTSLPKYLSFLRKAPNTSPKNQSTKIYQSKIINRHRLSIEFRKIIAQAIAFGFSIGPRLNHYELSLNFWRWVLAFEISKPDYSFLVAIERLIGIPHLLVSKEEAQYSCVQKDTLKLLGVKLPNEHCDDWDTQGQA